MARRVAYSTLAGTSRSAPSEETIESRRAVCSISPLQVAHVATCSSSRACWRGSSSPSSAAGIHFRTVLQLLMPGSSQKFLQRRLQRLGRAEDERLDGTFGTAEGGAHVLVVESIHPREQHGRPLLGGERGQRRLQVRRQLAPRCSRLRVERGWIGDLRALALLFAVARGPEVDASPPLRTPQIVQAEVGDDLVEPGAEARFRTIARAEPEDLDEYILDDFFRTRVAADQPTGVAEHAGAVLAEELAEGGVVPALHAQHQCDVGIGGRGRAGRCVCHSIRGGRSRAVADACPLHPGRDSTRFGYGFPGGGNGTHHRANTPRMPRFHGACATGLPLAELLSAST